MANVPSIRDMFPDFNDVFSPAFNDFLGVSSYPKVDLVENEKEYKFIDELQKKYPKYNELIEAFGKINKKMSTHMQKLNITIEW